MDDLKGFLMEDIAPVEEVSYKVSKRFPREFVLKAITEEKDKVIRSQSQKRVKQKGNTYTSELDTDLYMKKLVIETVIVPDFKNSELQAKWGVLGAEALLDKMFNPGELSDLLYKVREVNGYDQDPNELVEAAKN